MITPMSVTIAISQTTAGSDFEANLSVARSHITDAKRLGASLLAFPEVFLLVADRQAKLAHAQSLDGEVIEQFREQAVRHSMALLLGSFHERIPDDDQHVYNTSLLIGANGELLATYRKRNLFDLDLPQLVLRESDTIRRGGAPPPVVDTPWGRLGLTICFDLRFSELYLDLRTRAAEVVFIPSNFTVPTGAAHWEVLLRARAIEGQFFVVAPAQGGQHHARYRSYGHSMAIDPWGSVLAVNRGGPGVMAVDIDLDMVRRVRTQLPLRRHGVSAADGRGTPHA